MQVKQIYMSLLVITLAIILTGCFPFGPEEISEFDVVATYYNEDFNFGKVEKFAMPDSVGHISSGTSTISRAYDEVILEQVASNMKALGYEREMDPQANGADVLVIVQITNEDYNLFSSAGSSDGYGGYDYDGYYYPGYGGTTQTVRTGTVIIRMLDPNNPSDENTVPTEWIGLINGLTDDTSINVRSRLVNTINQCFVQSTYLGANL